MLFKNIIRIIRSYKFSIIKIFFYEILYIVQGYKGNNYSFSKNDNIADNIPCPYFFLVKINFLLKQYDYKNFFDFGCGSGRVIYYFNRKSLFNEYHGYEIFDEPYNKCLKLLKKNDNIKIFKKNFEDIKIKKKDLCFFFNLPYAKENEFIDFLKHNKDLIFEKKI